MTCRDLDVEEAVVLVILDQRPGGRPRGRPSGDGAEHAEEASTALDLGRERTPSSTKVLPTKSMLWILNFGPSKISKTTLVSPYLSTFDQPDLGLLVALLLVEFLNRWTADNGLARVGPGALLEVGGLLDVLSS